MRSKSLLRFPMLSRKICLILIKKQFFFLVLKAINEDSPTVPTLLTDYILKGVY